MAITRSSRSIRKRGGYHDLEWDTPTKNQCYGSMDAGQSLHKTHAATGVHRDTLRKWRKQRDVGHTVRRKGAERTGKARKVSDWEIKKVLNWVLKEKYLGRRLSFAHLCKRHNLSIHPRILARRLARLGYRKYTACPKPLINEKNRKIRLAFSIKFENWTHAWKRVRFSDESTFYTGKHKMLNIQFLPAQ